MIGSMLAARSFRPSSLGNLALWLDASVTSSLTFNGNNISEWRDLSGNARHYAQSTAANQPDGTGRTQNGLRVIDFDGTRRLSGNADSLAMARNKSAVTVFAVARCDDLFRATSFEGGRYIFLHSRNGAANSSRVLLGLFGGGSAENPFIIGGRRLDTDGFQSISSTANTNANVLTGILNYGSATASLFVNGASVASSSSFQTAGNTQDTSSTASSIGFDGATLNHLDGFVAELIVYERALSSAERLTVERYLGRKWGIAV